jgi:hypothetical protein
MLSHRRIVGRARLIVSPKCYYRNCYDRSLKFIAITSARATPNLISVRCPHEDRQVCFTCNISRSGVIIVL